MLKNNIISKKGSPFKISKLTILRFLPLFVTVTLFLVGVVLGIADPEPPPPPPDWY
ncbi:MAG: hypothetical protein ACTSPG_05880 [Candidatus Hodarchaeales archaeon]